MTKTILLTVFLFLTSDFLPGQSLQQRLYLIGDGGKLHEDEHPVTLQVIKKIRTQSAHVLTDVVFLGDNIYPAGLPHIHSKKEQVSKEILDAQLAVGKVINGRLWMIPGNHDWQKGRSGGYKAILRAQAYIDSLRMDNISWMPRDACPGPYVTDLNENTLMVIIDSQWWLHQHEKPAEDSDCEYKTEGELLAAIGDILKRNPQKVILLAMHHPMRTYGDHNGGYHWKGHIFPLTAKVRWAYLPLPVIGSIYPLYRTHFGSIQDVPHPRYQLLIKGMEKVLDQHPNVIVASGHEHALAYTQEDKTHHILSGAGAKTAFLKRKSPAKFLYGKQGYATLDFFSDGQIRLAFFSLENGDSAIYEHVLIDRTTGTSENSDQGTIELPDSVIKAASERYRAGSFRHFVYGKNYRKEWTTPSHFETFIPDKEGFNIIKRGGGMQTRSLRLSDESGKQFVLRSVEKYPEAAIPAILRKTVAKDIVQDQISASHPYGALVVPPLAQAAGVIHTHPKLVWLPSHPTLGVHQKDFSEGVFLFEEREVDPENLEEKEYKYYSTDKMLRKRYEDNDYEINQEEVLRARLLDVLIGDWDRHDDQWRWVGIETKKGREFIPMPRDRDQAFFVNKGVLPKIASRKWIMPKFQGFDYEMRDINGFMFNGRYFDRSFLNDLDRKDWERVVNAFITNMTDDVLEQAVKNLPEKIFALSGKELTAKLKHRKTWLREEALTYYRFIAKNVDVYGSYKDELFRITHQKEGKVEVEVLKISKKGNVKQQIYHRIFDPEETKEVRLYGLGGQDEFELSGAGKGKIKVRIMSGVDPDKIRDESELSRKSNLVYQWTAQNDDLQSGKATRIIKVKTPEVYEYDRKSFKYDLLSPLISLEYNVDDGIFLGGGFRLTEHGFRKDPYSLSQSFKGNLAVSTAAFNFYYQGHAVNALGSWDLEWNADVKAPNYVNNFFGFGNERSSFDKENRGISFYRVRYNLTDLSIAFRKNLSKSITFKMGPTLQQVKVDTDDNREKFIDYPALSGLNIDALNRRKLYGGLTAQLEIDNTDNHRIPARGVKFLNEVSHLEGLNDASRDITAINSELVLYWTFYQPSRITWATRFGGGVNWGDYEFFQAQTIGGMDNLRGYRRNRFSGDAMLYNNTEARIKLAQLRTYLLPFTVGAVVFHDVGRVWYSGEKSAHWHNSYGVGLWLAPLDLLVVTAQVGIGQEEILPSFTFGFQF